MSLPLDTKPAIMYPRDETPRQEKTLRRLKPFIAQQIRKMSESLINEQRKSEARVSKQVQHISSQIYDMHKELQSVRGKIREDLNGGISIKEQISEVKQEIKEEGKQEREVKSEERKKKMKENKSKKAKRDQEKLKNMVRRGMNTAALEANKEKKALKANKEKKALKANKEKKEAKEKGQVKLVDNMIGNMFDAAQDEKKKAKDDEKKRKEAKKRRREEEEKKNSPQNNIMNLMPGQAVGAPTSKVAALAPKTSTSPEPVLEKRPRKPVAKTVRLTDQASARPLEMVREIERRGEQMNIFIVGDTKLKRQWRSPRKIATIIPVEDQKKIENFSVNSEEKTKADERTKVTLQRLFYPSNAIPDSPTEPDIRAPVSSGDKVKIIPHVVDLSNEEGQDRILRLLPSPESVKEKKEAKEKGQVKPPPRIHQARVTAAAPIEVIPAALPKRVRPIVQQVAIVIDSDDENEPPAVQINPPKKLKNDDVIVID